MGSSNLTYLRNRERILAKARAKREAMGCRTYNTKPKPSQAVPEPKIDRLLAPTPIEVPKDDYKPKALFKPEPKEPPIVKEIKIINSSSLNKIFKIYSLYCKDRFSKVEPILSFLEWFHKEVKGPNPYQLVDSRAVQQYERSLAVKIAGRNARSR